MPKKYVSFGISARVKQIGRLMQYFWLQSCHFQQPGVRSPPLGPSKDFDTFHFKVYFLSV